MFDRMLSAAADAPLVAYLYTRGGIGESTLLRHAARSGGTHAAATWCISTSASSARSRAASRRPAAPACVQSGTVLLLDSFEHCQQLEPWLRNTFMLQLAQVHSLSSQAGLPRCRMVTGSLLSAARRRNRRAAV